MAFWERMRTPTLADEGKGLAGRVSDVNEWEAGLFKCTAWADFSDTLAQKSDEAGRQDLTALFTRVARELKDRSKYPVPMQWPHFWSVVRDVENQIKKAAKSGGRTR